MMALLERIQDIWSSIRVADLADVAVVALMVYVVITRFHRARSRFVMLGVAALLGLYFVARVAGMYLTLSVFQVGITLALVTLVVIFQEDIRRAFERIGAAGSLGPEAPRSRRPSELTSILVRSLSRMAAQNVGALVVLKGREPLERHLTGGVELRGLPSEPLLLSIFDPHTPGHDGAVILEGSVVRRFAVHLPLSTRIKDGARLGTRHTAALGLSERSDSLVVVASEERGAISVAHRGTIEEVSPEILEQRIGDFIGELSPDRRRGWLRRALAGNLVAKGVSVAVAAGAWLVLVGLDSTTVARSFSVPIVYENVPSRILLDEPNTLEARVTLSGSSRAFRLLDPAALTISIDASRLRPGAQTVALEEDRLRRPAGFTVHRIEPASITLIAHQTVPVELKVRPTLEGKLPHGLELTDVSVEPSSVRAWVRSGDRGKIATIKTETIRLSDFHGPGSVTRDLITPKGARLAEDETSQVRVNLQIRPR